MLSSLFSNSRLSLLSHSSTALEVLVQKGLKYVHNNENYEKNLQQGGTSRDWIRRDETKVPEGLYRSWLRQTSHLVWSRGNSSINTV